MYPLPPLPVKKKARPAYKKPDAVKELEAMAFEAACKAHPSVSRNVIAPRTFRDDTANGLTACIVAYAKLHNCFASRLNTTGVYDTRLRKFRFSTQRRGLPDILITGKNGLSIFVEVKVKKDRMSEFQEKVRNEQQAAAGEYFVAKDLASFITWFNAL